ncbi:hypothetical protein M513_08428 [Trichuris suis]|uniref:Uncharacterized protein n=1 Tax=Trichuris suis TaxID=68888 RepID=A0A085M075_9BILA|nr:hypothetical protein M513_08428 [Trichuris suis]
MPHAPVLSNPGIQGMPGREVYISTHADGSKTERTKTTEDRRNVSLTARCTRYYAHHYATHFCSKLFRTSSWNRPDSRALPRQLFYNRLFEETAYCVHYPLHHSQGAPSVQKLRRAPPTDSFACDTSCELHKISSPPRPPFPSVVRRERRRVQEPANAYRGQVALQGKLSSAVCYSVGQLRFKDVLEIVIPEWVSNPFEAEPTHVGRGGDSRKPDRPPDSDNSAETSRRRPTSRTGFQRCDKEPKFYLSFFLLPICRVVTLTKSRNRTDIAARGDLRLSLSDLKPNIAKLAEKHQPQGSH